MNVVFVAGCIVLLLKKLWPQAVASGTLNPVIPMDLSLSCTQSPFLKHAVFVSVTASFYRRDALRSIRSGLNSCFLLLLAVPKCSNPFLWPLLWPQSTRLSSVKAD